MAKKTFKNSPAMQFITPAEQADSGELQNPGTDGSTQTPGPILAAPENPSYNTRVKRDPAYVETRSKRVQLLMQPSLHTGLKALAEGQNVSLNDLVHGILADYLTRHTFDE